MILATPGVVAGMELPAGTRVEYLSQMDRHRQKWSAWHPRYIVLREPAVVCGVPQARGSWLSMVGEDVIMADLRHDLEMTGIRMRGGRMDDYGWYSIDFVCRSGRPEVRSGVVARDFSVGPFVARAGSIVEWDEQRQVIGMAGDIEALGWSLPEHIQLAFEPSGRLSSVVLHCASYGNRVWSRGPNGLLEQIEDCPR